MKFDKYYNVYDNYSIVQKKVAENLSNFIKNSGIENKKIETIFEIGCGTGIFTKKYMELFKESKIFLNDIFNTKEFFENYSYNDFICGDIEEIKIPRVDLIVSSSVLQWIKDFEKLVKKIANSSNNFCFSIYITGNLAEIKNHFGISLDYHDVNFIKDVLKKYFSNVNFYDEEMILEFDSPMSLLKHLKYTGVTGLQKVNSVSKIRSFKDKKLTYKVAYFVCDK